ncbi:PREDICTED: uncharacterized protein LOC107066036 [Polistes dominula]|uniref:Mediator of DNA damage checkpoint protein 1 n=1 Tax=Polistes dominula TaxID=743375 RepID=A0ABM1I6B8_POLDO|nr:PREDICTED: uncharacterized protein LOC107066036 [Polistes dominula]
MDLLATQPYDYDDLATQKIEIEPEKIQNIQVGELKVNFKSYPIYKGITNIGRHSNCHIQLDDQSISKFHAEIETHTYPSTSWISDLNSSNKTILNNVVLRPKRYYELKDNSTIQFGRVKVIYKVCHSSKELTIPETPERSNRQHNVTVRNSKTPDRLLTPNSTSNKSNCSITNIQECSKKLITSFSSKNRLIRETLQNIGKQSVSTERTVSCEEVNSLCDQNERSISYESDDIFDAATQHVNIDSYLKSIQDSSLQKEMEKQEEEDVSNIDNTATLEQNCDKVGSTSTPIRKTNAQDDQVNKLNSIERDIASATKRLRSKNNSSPSVKENNKKKINVIDITSPDRIPNSNKRQAEEKINDLDNIETLDTQIINIESNNRSDSVKKLQANKIDINKCSSSIEDIDYETASTQIIGEIEITNSKTFKLAKSNLQSDVQEEEDDDILSRLPEVNISGTLSNSATPVKIVKRTNKSRRTYNNSKTVNKSDTTSKSSKSKSVDKKNEADTTLRKSDKNFHKTTTNTISQIDNNKSGHSMSKRSKKKENVVSDIKSSTDKPEVNTKSKRNKKNTRNNTNERTKSSSGSMTNKEKENKNDTSEEEMGEESQEIAMIMNISLINDSETLKNISSRKRKISDVNLDDNSLINSNNISRKRETSNEKHNVPVSSRAKRKKLGKNSSLQSSLDSIRDDSLTNKDKDTKSPPSTRNSSLTRSTSMKKEINQNNTTISRKRKKIEDDILMDVKININTSDVSKYLTNVSPNVSFSTAKEKVLFTGVTDDDYVKILKSLGGVKVNDPSECTVLVTDKIRRTTKFLCTLAKAVPIVSVNWLLESKRAGYFLDLNNYLLKDPAMEAKYGFRLRKSLENAKERQLLDGYTVLLTPNIISPPVSELRTIIASCGGKSFLRAPLNLPTKTVIISIEKDLDKTKKWLAKAPSGTTVQSTEFLLTGILKQELDFVKYKLT